MSKIPIDFNYKLYLQMYLDLQKAGLKSENEAKNHYLNYGIFEGRKYTSDLTPYFKWENNNIRYELNNLNNTNNLIFLISHENSNTGAVNALKNIEKFFLKNNINVIMLYLNDICNIDIVSYIKKKSSELHSFPIVICNTLVCGHIAKIICSSNIITYLYIHEWIDKITDFKLFNCDINIFNYPIITIFISQKSFENIKTYIPYIYNYIIITNGISSDLLNNKINKIPKLNNIPIQKNSDDIFIMIVGTIENRKNQQAFIDNVFYKCKNKYKNVKLFLIGKVHKNLVIDKLYDNFIIIVGEVDNALPYINIADIIVSYSLNEVFPLNILESMYCEKSVVSSNVGSISDIIIHNENGYLFNANDADMCFFYICNLIENLDLRKQIGKNAKIHFLTNFEENITLKKLLSLIVYNWNYFNWEEYIQLNNDLVLAGINNLYSAVFHYLIYGKAEKRQYSLPKICLLPKTLIIYTFSKYTKYVKYFIDNGIINNPNYQYMIIINNLIIKIDVPDNVIVFNRENIGYDFGAWSYGLLTNEYYKNFDRFIFLNSSICGPFTTNNILWPEIFFNILNNNIKLAGLTINTWGYNIHDFQNNPVKYSHIQSMIYCMKKETLNILINNNFFSLNNFSLNYDDAVNNEYKLSRLVLDNIGNIGCLMNIHKNIDFRNLPYNFENIGCIIHNPNIFIKYFKTPYDCVFIKNNRGDEIFNWLNKFNIFI
jgi:glycosyltransferase involved in cell wall biosynthesis